MAGEKEQKPVKAEKGGTPTEKAPKGEKPEKGAPAEKVEKKAEKKKVKRLVPKAIVYIKATFNNTLITFTDLRGETLCWASAGVIGYKGSRKSTPFAAQKAMENAAEKAKKMGVREVDVKIKGPGAGREASIRALQVAGLTVRSIEDITPVPHNGCRVPKRRRV